MNSPIVPLTFVFALLIILPLRSNATVLPIRMADKFILIEGTADDVTGYFVLDTGASGLILNARYFRSKSYSGLTAFGVNGEPAKVETLYVDFELREEKWKGQQAALIPLDYLEVAKDVEILGLVGGDLFWKYEMLIDFEKMEVHLQRAGKGGESLLESLDFDAVLPMSLKAGMPCMEVGMGNKNYILGLDTASEDNMISRNRRDELEPWLSDRGTKFFRGISREISEVESGYLSSVRIGDSFCGPMSTLFTDLSGINWNFSGPNIDGILGFELLRQYRVAINFKNKVIALSPYRTSILMDLVSKGAGPRDSTLRRQPGTPVLLPAQHDRNH
ncbi:MAG TPA: hypothetical protein PKE06_15470 [Flavilitoribacter sp.]|nr:hypothetical protein [Flavilitoribacter sp.]HMQ86497.1 hypothetical protein [Flavilitoribacter sp.]